MLPSISDESNGIEGGLQINSSFGLRNLNTDDLEDQEAAPSSSRNCNSTKGLLGTVMNIYYQCLANLDRAVEFELIIADDNVLPANDANNVEKLPQRNTSLSTFRYKQNVAKLKMVKNMLKVLYNNYTQKANLPNQFE